MLAVSPNALFTNLWMTSQGVCSSETVNVYDAITRIARPVCSTYLYEQDKAVYLSLIISKYCSNISWDRLQQIPVTLDRTKRVWMMDGGWAMHFIKKKVGTEKAFTTMKCCPFPAHNILKGILAWRIPINEVFFTHSTTPCSNTTAGQG